MEEIRAWRFRYAMKTLEPYFENGSLILLHCNYGYLAFTSARLHASYGNSGNGQWGEVKDRFYFTYCFDGQDKATLQEKGTELELWDYGFQEDREAMQNKLGGALPALYSKRGFSLLYRKVLTPYPERKKDEQADNLALEEGLSAFLTRDLPSLESLLLS